MRSVLDHVLEHAERNPNGECVRLFTRRHQPGTRTWREIADAARRAAALLHGRGIGRGDVVALVGSYDLDLHGCWLGCQWVGAVPAILAEPSVRIDKSLYWSRLSKLLEFSGAKLLLRSTLVEETVSLSGQSETYASAVACELAPPDRHTPSASDVMLLQHSSGTTGLQKGVMLSHGAVMTHASTHQKRSRLSDSDVVTNWMPLYHDFGFIGAFVEPMIFGARVVWLSPFEWAASPGLLIDAISEQKGTYVAMPNFAFTFMARLPSVAPTTDLSSLRRIASGGEPVTSHAIDAFISRFEPHGLRRDAVQTVYGMAETVLLFSSTTPESPPQRRVIRKQSWVNDHHAELAAEGEPETLVHVSSGLPLEGAEIRVKDTDGQPCAPCHAGRIFLRAPYLFSGYNRRDDLNAHLFDADGFYDTGDAGYVDEAGNVFVTGRLDDVVIIGGKNLYLQDVEEVAAAVPGVHPGRVVSFAIHAPKMGTDGVVVLAESDEPEERWLEIARAIRQALIASSDLDLAGVQIVPRQSLRKSTSGKLARKGNREWYLEGRFAPGATAGRAKA